ncbi:CS012 protein, partial [Cettia cetti]|nr:CS012 protein [Cettia cetti]
LGAAVGGFIGWMTSQSFKSVPQILMELPAAEKQKLRDQVKAVVKNLNWTDVRHLIRLVMTNTDLLERVLGLLTNYLAKKLKAKIKYAK